MLGANRTVSVYHVEVAAGLTDYADTAAITGVSCYIEKLAPEDAVLLDFGGSAIGLFKMFTDPGIAIVVGDKIVDQSSVAYQVKALVNYENNTDVPNHSEYIISKS